jgi:hypothetical protein
MKAESTGMDQWNSIRCIRIAVSMLYVVRPREAPPERLGSIPFKNMIHGRGEKKPLFSFIAIALLVAGYTVGCTMPEQGTGGKSDAHLYRASCHVPSPSGATTSGTRRVDFMNAEHGMVEAKNVAELSYTQ